MAIDRQESPYRRGNRYEVMPIPMVADHCIPVAAGAVQLVVESRQLTDQILAETYADGEIPEAEVHFDDFGASLHVCGAETGSSTCASTASRTSRTTTTSSRSTQANVIVRIDELAVGDPIDFSLNCVETPPARHAAQRGRRAARRRSRWSDAAGARRGRRGAAAHGTSAPTSQLRSPLDLKST